MRKSFLYIFITSLVALYSCSANEDYLKYDTSQQDEVYIALPVTNIDSVNYNFGFDNITTDTIKVTVALIGMPKDYDREFTVEINNDRYASEEWVAAKEEYYEIPTTFTMPKDSVTVTLPIVLKRHAGLSAEKAIITIQIKPTDDLAINGHDEYTVTFDDFLPPMPYWWNYSTNITDLGEYTLAKYMKIIELFTAFGEKDPYMYGVISELNGKYLDINYGNSGYYSMKFFYPVLFRENIWMPLYDFQESAANDGSISGVSNPY